MPDLEELFLIMTAQTMNPYFNTLIPEEDFQRETNSRG
jgi:hypothetical protein